MFGHVWSCLLMFAHVWSCLLMLGKFDKYGKYDLEEGSRATVCVAVFRQVQPGRAARRVGQASGRGALK